ncbi:AAA-like domain-containing protein [Micromonospora nigra]|uniref:AAA-like domain-containing protein n=1 Tax=Micromonospora nigra TaxID=145857 RepID=A0A1C6R7I1_9ACTN|nr:AAA-like domain-containing protein [Micromonospora nigra]
MLAPAPWRWRRSPLLGRFGVYAPRVPGILSTTRQSEVLCTAISAPPTHTDGILNGIDLVTGQPIHHDPFTAYQRKTVSSPNVVVLGDVGKGKSALIKTVYVYRPLAFRNRRTVVADRKDQGGEGEYSELCRQLGGQPIRFQVGAGGSRINLLDPVIGVSAESATQLAGQLQLLRAVVHAASGAEPDSWQGAALRTAHIRALSEAEAAGRIAVVDDVIAALRLAPPTEMFGDVATSAARDRFAEAALGLAFDLERVCGDDLAGLFDGPTSRDVGLADRLTSFDLSQLPTEGPAIPLVMTVLNTWLTNLLRRRRGWQTTFVAEEGWHLAEGVGARLFQRNSKLARGIGLANVVALHHLADIPEDSPAVAMLKEAETVYMYAQAREDDASRCVRLYSLPPHLLGDLMTLQQGVCLLRIGAGAPLLMQHLRSSTEVALTDTDAAMTGTIEGGAR